MELFVAEAYGIPARQLRITENEPLFKFKDYYLRTNAPFSNLPRQWKRHFKWAANPHSNAIFKNFMKLSLSTIGQIFRLKL